MNAVYFYAGLEMCEWKTQLHVKLTTYGMIQWTCIQKEGFDFTSRHKYNSIFIIILLYNYWDIHVVYMYQYWLYIHVSCFMVLNKC